MTKILHTVLFVSAYRPFSSLSAGNNIYIHCIYTRRAILLHRKVKISILLINTAITINTIKTLVTRTSTYRETSLLVRNCHNSMERFLSLISKYSQVFCKKKAPENIKILNNRKLSPSQA